MHFPNFLMYWVFVKIVPVHCRSWLFSLFFFPCCLFKIINFGSWYSFLYMKRQNSLHNIKRMWQDNCLFSHCLKILEILRNMANIVSSTFCLSFLLLHSSKNKKVGVKWTTVEGRERFLFHFLAGKDKKILTLKQANWTSSSCTDL